MKKILCLILSVLIIGSTSLIPMVTVMANTETSISGTVFLPTAAESDIVMQLYLIYPSDDNEFFFSEITINSGSSYADYSIMVPTTAKYSNYILGYYIVSDNTDYVREAYFKDGGTITTDFDQATPVDITQGNQSGFDITLIEENCVSLSGTLSLPNGQVAPSGGLGVVVELESYNNYYSSYVTIPEYNNSVDYTIKVPYSEEANTYYLYYFIWNDEAGYLNKGYYSINGTVINQNNANTVSVGSSNLEGYDIALIKGTLLSGTISLQDNEKAPAGGIQINIVFRSFDSTANSYSKHVIIPEGSNSIDFKGTVTPSSTKYLMQCTVTTDNTFFVKNQYYNSISGTTLVYGNAEEFSISTDKSNINMTLMKGTIISGVISLPDGQLAPTGGLYSNILLESSEGYDFFATSIYMDKGSNSASYTIAALPSSQPKEYKLYYNFYTSDTIYEPNGYYTSNGTILNSENAELIDISLGNQTKNLTLLVKDTGYPFAITDVFADEGNVSVDIANLSGSENLPVLFVTMYNSDNKVIKVLKTNISTGVNSYSFNTNIPEDMSRTMAVLWENANNIKPVSMPKDYFNYIEKPYK